MMKRLAWRVAQWLLWYAYDPTRDRLTSYDNTKGQPCPACGIVPRPCDEEEGCDMTHDPCVGHITGARSACCGHGLDVGHIAIGEARW